MRRSLSLMGVTKKVLKEGSGRSAATGEKITVHCTGYVEQSDGTRKKFWSTIEPENSTPLSFNVGLAQVIKGWDEGMMTMKLGEEAELTMTPDYGYGDRGFPAWKIPPKATLTFVIQMLKIGA